METNDPNLNQNRTILNTISGDVSTNTETPQIISTSATVYILNTGGDRLAEIHRDTGVVKLNTSPDEAARAFWEAVSNMSKEYSSTSANDILDGDVLEVDDAIQE